MPESPSRKQISITHHQQVQVLDEIERKTYLEWVQKLDGGIHKKLAQPLLKCCDSTFSTLTINFDKWVNSNKSLECICFNAVNLS